MAVYELTVIQGTHGQIHSRSVYLYEEISLSVWKLSWKLNPLP